SNINSLPSNVKNRLTLENDDKIFTPQDLLPVCRITHIPLVYDIHHHRCNRDFLTEREATRLALLTWNREPLFHLSSPRNGWNNGDPKPHAEFISDEDFPPFWRGKPITVEIEAKAKEDAVLRCIN
ncbi:MAG: UV DNA damage repair endonuclease UvsE, partial [Lentisphaeria bacterium]